MQEASATPLHSRLQIPNLHLVEHLANNKGAAVAASVAGAAAGGALAGPFGIAAGEASSWFPAISALTYAV